jgi:hypothetical protein
MSFTWVSTGRSIRRPGAISLPVTRGLSGAFLLGEGPDQAVKNLVRGRSPGNVVGDVTWEDGYATFDGPDGYINTLLPDTESGTFAAFCRTSDGVTPALVAGVQGGGNSGANLYVYDSGGYRANMWQNLSGTATSIYSGNNRTNNEWAIMVATWSPTLIKLYDRTGDGLGGGIDAGGMSGGTPSGTRILATSRTVGIGGNANTTFIGQVDIAMLFKFDVDLTSDEVATLADRMRLLGADYSLAA